MREREGDEVRGPFLEGFHKACVRKTGTNEDCKVLYSSNQDASDTII